jgi:hypothetical protein
MANFTALNAALLANYLAEKGTEIFKKLLWEQGTDNWTTTVANMKNGMISPKFSMGASAKPFNTTLAATDNQTFDAAILKVYPNKIEEAIDPQKYYAYEQLISGATDGRTFDPEKFPFHQFITEELIRVNNEALRETAIWNGVRNNSGTTMAATVDGFNTLINNSVTGVSGAPVIPSQYIKATGALTAANTYDKVRDVVAAVPIKYRRQKDFQVLCGDTVWGDYWDGYKADRGGMIEPKLVDDDTLIIDAKWGKTVVLKRIQCMTTANSQRLIATPKSNLQVGTNMDKFGDYVLKVHDFGWTYAILAYFELGCGIFEYGDGALVVNDQL